MTNTEINLLIHAHQGWKPAREWDSVRTETHQVLRRGDEVKLLAELPDYCSDENACAVIERKIGVISRPAKDRAIAFCVMAGLIKE